MAIKPDEIKRLFDEAQSAGDTDSQGKAYEELAAYLFISIPGCSVKRNITSFFGSEQIDIGVGNAKHEDGLALFPNVIIVECKNWSRHVDSSTVGYFINILRNRSVEVGILIAAKGITGNSAERTNAYSLGPPAMADKGIRLLVISDKDILALTCTEDLVELLNDLYLDAALKGGIGVRE